MYTYQFKLSFSLSPTYIYNVDLVLFNCCSENYPLLPLFLRIKSPLVRLALILLNNICLFLIIL